MLNFKGAKSAVSVIAVVAATSAHADVTPQEVWDNWKGMMDIYGSENVTIGSEVASGDTLTISDLAIKMVDPETTITAQMDEIVLTDLGNGTVSITTSEVYPITIEMTPEYGDAGTLNVSARHSDMEIIVSGDAEQMNYAIDAPTYTIQLDGIEGDGADEVEFNAAALTLSGLNGNYLVRTDNLQHVDYEMTLASVALDVDIAEPGGEGMFVMNGTIQDLQTQAQISMPLDMANSDPEMMFINGFAMQGGYQFGQTDYTFDFAADGETANGTASVDSGQLGVTFDKDGLAYLGNSKGIAIAANIPSELPFPIEASLGEYNFGIVAPLSQSDTPEDFGVQIGIIDLAVSEGIWSLIDPGQALPRDAATMSFDITGTATPFFDLLDPEQAEAAAMSEVPGELNSLSLNSLKLAIAGAMITGDGSFTFDNTDLETFDGMPRPEGALNLSINGVNGLMDKLIQMGLLPEDQAMGGRMMMGMFTTPVGDDMLTSTIEINEQGQVLANGQRLR